MVVVARLSEFVWYLRIPEFYCTLVFLRKRRERWVVKKHTRLVANGSWKGGEGGRRKKKKKKKPPVSHAFSFQVLLT